MERALYHPEHGYYGPGPRRLGRAGDFFTAVSVGPLYGRLLARLAEQTWQEAGCPEDFMLIEQGAHDGQLAADVLAGLETDAHSLAERVRFCIVEPNPRHEAAQRERLGDDRRVTWVGRPSQLPALPALFVCNELPDALPVNLVRWSCGEWRELFVEADAADGLRFAEGALSSTALEAEVARLPRDLQEGFTTEVNLAALEWLRRLAHAPFHGTVFIADYGLDAGELLAPERAQGTLRRYFRHQMDVRVLEDLGACDLTAHVNFTRLIAEAEAGGMSLRAYEHQGRFLAKLALPLIQSLDGRLPDAGTQALLRQYQSLTHPGFMGRSFRVVMLEKP